MVLRNEQGRFVSGHSVPISWREEFSKKYKGKHFSPKTEFKKGHKTIHSEETKRKIGKANAIKMKGKHNSPNTEFKKGENHKDWEGGKHLYWHKMARKIMKNAGFDIDGLHVHHKNHNYRDNRLENLELLIPKEHGRLHALDRLN